MKKTIYFFAKSYRQALFAVYWLRKNINFHEASFVGGVVGGTSILPTSMASPYLSNTPQPGVQPSRCFVRSG